jgi:hypothetical protein
MPRNPAHKAPCARCTEITSEDMPNIEELRCKRRELKAKYAAAYEGLSAVLFAEDPVEISLSALAQQVSFCSTRLSDIVRDARLADWTDG